KYIITHGFTKKTQKTPAREITKSKEYRKDYLERKGEKDGK
ncbi:type II toxin-antitoxin system RelE/ParE family toxin, partial [Listeria monocytogenes]|nr:type II toxin-antitoxin system RelE/ParE family toxin [Listeria monocytogenes]EJB2521811.1 type II toxin-antitoxin system RelE/ParE family toxin [Listeria monocytogenes]EJB2690143.1 type II toxin-antitoxin system RelE/ParE family toxin [Listeria monocytogenes]EJE4582942.1 type II toxin-antitoxin system RelE/ParE family toxin [Listeria monocytogenes]EJE4647695.1 type II toxin-antitoxin system RelE/ParE family toxin [Listeria monocytogenes]